MTTAPASPSAPTRSKLELLLAAVVTGLHVTAANVGNPKLSEAAADAAKHLDGLSLGVAGDAIQANLDTARVDDVGKNIQQLADSMLTITGSIEAKVSKLGDAIGVLEAKLSRFEHSTVGQLTNQTTALREDMDAAGKAFSGIRAEINDLLELVARTVDSIDKTDQTLSGLVAWKADVTFPRKAENNAAEDKIDDIKPDAGASAAAATNEAATAATPPTT